MRHVRRLESAADFEEDRRLKVRSRAISPW
jgi:hypothetical protein